VAESASRCGAYLLCEARGRDPLGWEGRQPARGSCFPAPGCELMGHRKSQVLRLVSAGAGISEEPLARAASSGEMLLPPHLCATSRPASPAVIWARRVEVPLLSPRVSTHVALDSLVGFHLNVRSLCPLFECCVSTSFFDSIIQQLGQFLCCLMCSGVAVAESAPWLQ